MVLLSKDGHIDRARLLTATLDGLDSTPIYGAVATQDTVTQLRAAVRKLLRALEGPPLAEVVRSVLRRDDD